MAIERGTTRKGDQTKRPQKYQNQHAYKHNKNSRLTRKIASIPIRELCSQCTEILEWKKKYRKYKPLTVPKKCIRCFGKTIFEAYHVICHECFQETNLCSKCQDPIEVKSEEIELESDIQSSLLKQEQDLKYMNERKRRTYLRNLEKGKPLTVNELSKPTQNSENSIGHPSHTDDSLEIPNISEINYVSSIEIYDGSGNEETDYDDDEEDTNDEDTNDEDTNDEDTNDEDTDGEKENDVKSYSENGLSETEVTIPIGSLSLKN